jgi:steroid delta-isomerase-like uncharacterized protein
MAEATPDAERIVNDYVDLWNGGPETDIADVVSETVAIHDPAAPGGELHGRDEFEAFLDEVSTGFPDFHVAVDDMLAGDDVVMAEWTVTGTHEGEFDGIPPTGRAMEMAGMSKMLFADGRVQEDRLYYDLQAMFDQLGLADE